MRGILASGLRCVAGLLALAPAANAFYIPGSHPPRRDGDVDRRDGLRAARRRLC